ncbi:MAG TPA: DUF6134 family protein [Methylibium sp.]|uniref:DUF6134 family protein n=1 Tax=Methylibium sp. TaxID=2067992 RepID=UPI002DBAA992|nr:DUF6134 family protein [Methylibium sp.]HEU4459406.1 DUF6134 family protein [Methylibium sp.]
MKRVLVALLCAASFAAHAERPASGSWNFRVLLDGKPIGTHRFTLKGDGERRSLEGKAAFDVKVLGLTAYRYRHEVEEQWQGDCLVALSSKTDDDGKALAVQAKKDGDALAVKSNDGSEMLEGCVMSFAYWHPAMLKQTRLLNAQTGKYERVKIEPLGDAKLDVQGRPVDAKRWRISGPESPVELWYSADGDWLALESKVSRGKRTLRYVRE